MRFKLFEKIKPESMLNTAGPALFCVIALTTTLWSLKGLDEDEDTVQFILDGLTDRMDRQDSSSDNGALYI